MEWLALLIPVVLVVFSYIKFGHEIIWWEAAIPIFAGLLYIGIFKAISESVLVQDVEYWNETIVETGYVEDWNEYIHQICTSTDSEGNVTTYDCSYVAYHGEYWYIEGSGGSFKKVTSKEYERLVKRFGTGKKFVDMRRNYHTNDGDKYVTKWPRTDYTREIIVTKHNYENRVQASHSIFNYEELDEYDYNTYTPYDYPPISHNYKQKHTFGIDDSYFKPKLERDLEIFNAKYGESKELKLFLCVYPNQLKKAAEVQENYWKGGNKNELIICIGTTGIANQISWVHIISWTENEEFKIELRNKVLKEYYLTSSLITNLTPIIVNDFERKHFSDFNYIEVDLTTGQLIGLYITMLMLSIGLSAFIVMNDVK